MATLVSLLVMVFYVATMWRLFAKAGEPGWASIVPIYNSIVLLKIAGKPVWWIVLFLIPLVNVVMLFVVMIGLAEKFGKSAAFGVGLAVLGFIFFPILGFGDALYRGNENGSTGLMPAL